MAKKDQQPKVSVPIIVRFASVESFNNISNAVFYQKACYGAVAMADTIAMSKILDAISSHQKIVII